MFFLTAAGQRRSRSTTLTERFGFPGALRPWYAALPEEGSARPVVLYALGVLTRLP